MEADRLWPGAIASKPNLAQLAQTVWLAPGILLGAFFLSEDLG